ncbi:MAG: phosphatase PAP2 family protein [Pseudomonadota bacterium]
MSNMIAYFNYLEGGICLKINKLSHRLWLRRLFSVVSKLGNGWVYVLPAAAIFALQGPASLPALLQAGLTALAGVFTYKYLKQRLVRERPYINHGDILCGAAPLDRYSFPSGHTLHAACFTTMYAHIEPMLLPILLPFALLVAASRIVLGLHYPSDVIVGASIGLALASASIALF